MSGSLEAGWVPEWSIGHAWKACVLQKGTEGSNPSPSALSEEGFTVPGALNHPRDHTRLVKDSIRLIFPNPLSDGALQYRDRDGRSGRQLGPRHGYRY